MNKQFPLSELSRTRIKRGNVISLVFILLTIALAYATSNTLIAIGTLYFLAKILLRFAILRNSGAFLQVSHEGLTICWVRKLFLPWEMIVEVVDSSKDVISIRYRTSAGKKLVEERLLKRRIDADHAELIGLLRKNLANK